MNEGKHLKVNAIKNGTVIDHIPAKSLFKVINMLKLDHIDTFITFGTNLESKRLGRKAIIKIADKTFLKEDINKIALIAPQAKLNVIREYKVVEKNEVKVPDFIEGIIKCVNPKCVTNNEKVGSKFHILSNKDVFLKCYYCETITDQDHMELL